MRRKIIGNQRIGPYIQSNSYIGLFLYKYLIRLDEYEDASRELKKAGGQIAITIDTPFTPFLLNEIKKYDRFIKAKKELEECQDYKYILKLEAASPSIGKELAQNLNPPSQT